MRNLVVFGTDTAPSHANSLMGGTVHQGFQAFFSYVSVKLWILPLFPTYVNQNLFHTNKSEKRSCSKHFSVLLYLCFWKNDHQKHLEILQSIHRMRMIGRHDNGFT